MSRYVSIERTEIIPYGKYRRRMAYCICRCGERFQTLLPHIKRGNTSSYGCTQRQRAIEANLKHGEYSNKKASKELRIYYDMRNRCLNPNNTGYFRYGGRGIEFRIRSFKEFLDLMGRRPSPQHSVDRIDNNGHYEAGNLRWATAKEQANNRRPRSTIKNNKENQND